MSGRELWRSFLYRLGARGSPTRTRTGHTRSSATTRQRQTSCYLVQPRVGATLSVRCNLQNRISIESRVIRIFDWMRCDATLGARSLCAITLNNHAADVLERIRFGRK